MQQCRCVSLNHTRWLLGCGVYAAQPLYARCAISNCAAGATTTALDCQLLSKTPTDDRSIQHNPVLRVALSKLASDAAHVGQ